MVTTHATLTVERLREVLDYEPETGVFRWRVNKRANASAGSVAGTAHNSGYWRIRIDRRGYLAQQLAWMHFYGRWPDKQLDHIDTNKHNNRIANLREATPTQNLGNRPMRRDNVSGVKGVTWHPRDQRWRAQITINGRVKYISQHRRIEDAAEAYRRAAEAYFGEFARTS